MKTFTCVSALLLFSIACSEKSSDTKKSDNTASSTKTVLPEKEEQQKPQVKPPPSEKPDAQPKEEKPVPPPAVEIENGTILFATVLHDDTSRSESRSIKKISKGLAKLGTVTEEGSSEAGNAYFQSLEATLADAQAPLTLPDSWKKYEKIVLIGTSDADPASLPRRQARGFKGYAVILPPNATPAYLEWSPQGASLLSGKEIVEITSLVGTKD